MNKNIARGSYKSTLIEAGFEVLRIKNESSGFERVEHVINKSQLQFHYCLKGDAQLAFNAGSYQLPVSDQQSYMLYNPTMDLPIDLRLSPDSWVVSVIITIKKFHSLFSSDADQVMFLNQENRDKKYYLDGKITPAMGVVLHQLMNYSLHDTIRQLYFKGKTYELLSLHFNRDESNAVAACPFLADEENMQKIRLAKDIVLEKMTDPPSLQDLSIQIGLSLKKLKEGFKEVYGDTVHNFALEHKMQHARQLLDSKKYNVNEVAIKSGYSTSSHFISAFKKKFGLTPKKYLSDS
jgi:AraC-like DNA-binding protein